MCHVIQTIGETLSRHSSNPHLPTSSSTVSVLVAIKSFDGFCLLPSQERVAGQCTVNCVFRLSPLFIRDYSRHSGTIFYGNEGTQPSCCVAGKNPVLRRPLPINWYPILWWGQSISSNFACKQHHFLCIMKTGGNVSNSEHHEEVLSVKLGPFLF